jgi:hypothetical protein
MNKQIKEIAKRAGFYEPMGLPSNWDEGDYIASPKEIEKFGELLLKEVLAIIDEVGYKASNSISADDTELFKTMLKRHFGVEQ